MRGAGLDLSTDLIATSWRQYYVWHNNNIPLAFRIDFDECSQLRATRYGAVWERSPIITKNNWKLIVV